MANTSVVNIHGNIFTVSKNPISLDSNASNINIYGNTFSTSPYSIATGYFIKGYKASNVYIYNNDFVKLSGTTFGGVGRLDTSLFSIGQNIYSGTGNNDARDFLINGGATAKNSFITIGTNGSVFFPDPTNTTLSSKIFFQNVNTAYTFFVNANNNLTIGTNAVPGTSSGTQLFNFSSGGARFGDGNTANTSAILDLSGTTTKAFLPPVLTTSQQNAISSPATGSVIWNSDSAALVTYTAANGWRTIGRLTTNINVTNQAVFGNYAGSSPTASFLGNGPNPIVKFARNSPWAAYVEGLGGGYAVVDSATGIVQQDLVATAGLNTVVFGQNNKSTSGNTPVVMSPGTYGNGAGTNLGGSPFTLKTGNGTGAGALQAFKIQTANLTSSGTTAQTWGDRLTIPGGAGTAVWTDTISVPKLNIVTGTNASGGTATLSSGTVTVSTTAVTASSLIFIQYLGAVSTAANILSTPTITAGTSFVITALTPGTTTTATGDNNTVKWFIIN